MKKITIPLSGISRNSDDTISSDGQCIELINARVKNGSIEPVGRPILEAGFTGGRVPMYIHKNSNYEHVIVYDANNNLIFDCKRENGTYVPVNSLVCTLAGIIQVESIGNTLVIATTNSVYYALYKDGVYKYLGNKPDFPEVSICYLTDTSLMSSDVVWCDIDPRIKMRNNEWVTLNSTSQALVNDSFRGTTNKFLKEMNNKCKYVYPCVARYALRLYDGSYIMHSAPILLSRKGLIPYIEVISQTNSDGYVTDFKYKVTAQPSTLHARYNLSSLEKWKDIVVSVDVFLSRQIMITDLEKDVTSMLCSNNAVSFKLNSLTDAEVMNRINTSTNFYKVKSLPIGGTSVYFEGLVDDPYVMENLEQQMVLPDDSFSHNTITGRLFSFNARLHVGNTKMTLAPFLPISIFRDQPSSDIGNITVNTEVHIKTESGIKRVRGTSRWDGTPISPYLSYPDSRAYKLVLSFIYSGKNYYRIFDLKAHPLLNTAYSLETLTPYSVQKGNFTEGTYYHETEDNVEYSPNKLKVSEVSNPFYFPPEQTYVISSRAIKAMAVATTALSTGQFGQFPLYVFTDEGIYALSTGSADVAYINAHPVSRHCCNNIDSIVSTDNAVVFSTESGLMILSGSTVQELSVKINGYLPSAIDSSPIIGKIAKVAGVEAGNILSRTEFVYFLDGAKVGYCFGDKEIIVSNPAYGYSYVYNTVSGEWHKIAVSVKRFINSYPECFAILSDNGMYNMYNQHRTVNKVLLLSRPVKFGSVTHKRILQSAIRGVLRPSLSNVYFRGESVKFRDSEVTIFSNVGFYVLGSNDAEHFSLIAGREKIVDVRDLITKMNKTNAFKYFMFAIAGGIRTDVALNYIEVMIDETFTNRLR